MQSSKLITSMFFLLLILINISCEEVQNSVEKDIKVNEVNSQSGDAQDILNEQQVNNVEVNNNVSEDNPTQETSELLNNNATTQIDDSVSQNNTEQKVQQNNQDESLQSQDSKIENENQDLKNEQKFQSANEENSKEKKIEKDSKENKEQKNIEEDNQNEIQQVQQEQTIQDDSEKKSTKKEDTNAKDQSVTPFKRKEPTNNTLLWGLLVTLMLISIAVVGFLSFYYRLYMYRNRKAPFEVPRILNCLFPRPINYEHEITVLCSKYMNN